MLLLCFFFLFYFLMSYRVLMERDMYGKCLGKCSACAIAWAWHSLGLGWLLACKIDVDVRGEDAAGCCMCCPHLMRRGIIALALA